MENQIQGNEKKKNVLIIALFVIIFLLFALCLYILLSKNNTPEEPKPQDNTEETTTIVAQDTDETLYYFVILDTKGDVYIQLKSIIDDEELVNNFNSHAKTYTFNGNTVKLIKVKISDINYVNAVSYGNGGAKYVVLVDKVGKATVFIDYKFNGSDDIQLLTHEKLNEVIDLYSECDTDGCSAYANAMVNGKQEKVSLYELFEQYENTGN